MSFVSAKTQVEQLKTELCALQDLLRYMTGERRQRVLTLIDDVERQIAERPLNSVVVIKPRLSKAS